MTTSKNPGLSARVKPVSIARAASKVSRPPEINAAEEDVPAIATSVRLPKPMYDALLDIVHGAKKRGEKISIHSVMLEGIAKVISEREAGSAH
jgi:hypothetical protein